MLLKYKIVLLVVASMILLTACDDKDLASPAQNAIEVKSAESGHDDQEEHDEHYGDGHHSDESDIVVLDASAAQEAGIEVAEATLSSTELTLTLPAEIRFDADRIANVSPQVSGVIRRLYASEGDLVSLGAPLALISSRELATMKADYLSAISDEYLALAALTREEKLWSEKISAEADLLSARAAATAASAARKSAENKLHAIGLDHDVIDSLNKAPDGALAEFVVTTPLAGTIIRRSVTLGETVVSGESGGVPLFTIADDSVVWADIAVFKKDLSRVSKRFRGHADR